MSKCTRSLSLILTLILSFSLFSVNAFAVDDENLIDYNFHNHWSQISNIDDKFDSLQFSTGTRYCGIKIPSGVTIPSGTAFVGAAYTLPNLTVGENYELYLPFVFQNPNNLFTVIVGFGFLDSEGNITIFNDNSIVYFSESVGDYSSQTNYEFKYNFEFIENLSLGVPCVYVSFVSNTNNFTTEYGTNFYLYSEAYLKRLPSPTEQKLDGILGWLESIWDSITSLGDKLTDVWTNITSSVSALGDRISDFFTNLTNSIKEEFTSLTSDFSGYISSLGDRISGYFENLSVNINAFFDDLLEGIKDFFRGFGNLILYFNWEGEYTNPFESSNSIIGGGSTGDGEGGSDSSSINLFSDLQFETTGKLNVVDYGDYYYVEFPYKSSSGLIYKTQRSIGVPIESEVNYLFSFDVSSFNIYNDCYILIESSYHSVKVPLTAEGSYSVEFPSSPVPDTVYITLAIYSRAQSYYNLYDLSLTAINASGDDTGSGEEGTTENVSVQGSLDNILEYLSTVTSDIENVMDSITGSIKLFSDFCDEFPFIKALCIFVLALIIYSTVIGL